MVDEVADEVWIPMGPLTPLPTGMPAWMRRRLFREAVERMMDDD